MTTKNNAIFEREKRIQKINVNENNKEIIRPPKRLIET